MKKRISLPDIPEQDQTPLVQSLLGLIEQLIEHVQQQDEEIALLKDEINILKGEKKRPVFKGGKLDKNNKTNATSKPRSKNARGLTKRKRRSIW